MDRYELLMALQEAEERTNAHFIEVVEIEKSKGNPVFGLYDPRNDEPVVSRPMYGAHKRPGAIRYGKRGHRSKGIV